MITESFNRTETTWNIETTHLGPTWEPSPDWKPGDDPWDRYLLPDLTLGWQVLAWIPKNLNGDEVDELGRPEPFKPTFEQKRFILWWYAIDENGRFLYREGILQRLKGWLLGQGPPCLCAVCGRVRGPLSIRRLGRRGPQGRRSRR